MGPDGAGITGGDVLADGGVTASSFDGERADDGGQMGATQS